MSFLKFAGGFARGASQEMDERDQRSQLIADRAVQRYLNKYDTWEANYNTDKRAYKEAYKKLGNEANFLDEQQKEMVLANGPDGVDKFLASMKSDYEAQYEKHEAAPDATGHMGIKDVPKPEFKYTDEMKKAFLGNTFKRSDAYLDAKQKGNLNEQMFLAKDLDTQAKLYAQGLNQLTPIDKSIDVMRKTMEDQASSIGVPVQYVQSQIRTQLANLGVTNPEIIEGTLGGGTGYNAPIYEILNTNEIRTMKAEIVELSSAELTRVINEENYKHMKYLNPLQLNKLRVELGAAKTDAERAKILKERDQIQLDYEKITKDRSWAITTRQLDNDIKVANLAFTNLQTSLANKQELRDEKTFNADKVNRMYSTAMGNVTSITQEITRLATQEPTENNKKLLATARTQLSDANNTLENITMTKMHIENMGKNSWKQDQEFNEYMVSTLDQKLIENHHYTGKTTIRDEEDITEETTTENPYFAVKDIDGSIRNVFKQNTDTSQEYFEIYNKIQEEVNYDFIQKWGNVSEDGKTVTIKDEHKFNDAMVRQLQSSVRTLVGDGTDVNLNEWRDTFLADKIGDLAPIVKQMIAFGEEKSEIIEELNVYTNNHKDSNMVYDILSIETEKKEGLGIRSAFPPTATAVSGAVVEEEEVTSVVVPKNTDLVNNEELTAFQNDISQFLATEDIGRAVNSVRVALSTGKTSLGTSPMSKLWGYFADDKEEREMRAKNVVAFNWWNSNEADGAREYFLTKATKNEFREAIKDPINYYYKKIAVAEKE